MLSISLFERREMIKVRFTSVKMFRNAFFIKKIDNFVRFCIPLLFTIIKGRGVFVCIQNWEEKSNKTIDFLYKKLF